MYKSVFVEPGNNGWGVGFTLTPSDKKNKVVSVTGGGIHPVAQRIADLTGAEAWDGFKNQVPEDEMLCAVIDCGGTARIGVYPMKRIPTVDILPSSPSGPLAKHITEDIFVSGVKPESIKLTNEQAAPQAAADFRTRRCHFSSNRGIDRDANREWLDPCSICAAGSFCYQRPCWL